MQDQSKDTLLKLFLALSVLLLLRVLVEMNELLINDRGSLGQYNKDDFSIVSEEETLRSAIIIH